MNNIIIVTATYNRFKRLTELYKSLVLQKNKNFTWLIVNDGSQDSTANVVDSFIKENILHIIYISKDNSGKSSSLNIAFNMIKTNNALVLIVDDDEYMLETAVDILSQYYEKYYSNNNIGMFHFNRIDKSNYKVISTIELREDRNMNFYIWKKIGFFADGYFGFFSKVFSDYKFPLYEHEKYIGPSVLLMLAAERYQMICSKEVLGITEYLDGGITKTGRAYRIRSPKGMIKYCILLQNKQAGIKNNLKYSIMGYGYQFYAHLKNDELTEVGLDMNSFNGICKIPGLLLALIWRIKIGKYNKN